jgi:tyrosinase
LTRRLIIYLNSYVDSQFAIWQTLNPDLWFDAPLPGDSLPTDPLIPFHTDTKRTYWTSEMTRDWRKLNYDYDVLEPQPTAPSLPTAPTGTPATTPQTQPGAPTTTTPPAKKPEYLAKVKESINKCYSITRRDCLKSPDLLGSGGDQTDYIINVVYDRYALGGTPYTIHFFLGVVDEVIQTFHKLITHHPNHIGSVFTFSSGVELNNNTGCQNCIDQRKAGRLSKAQIPITSVLLKHAGNPAISAISKIIPGQVEDYLTKNLHWKFLRTDGSEIPVSSLPETKIFIMAGKGEHAEDNSKLSNYHGYAPMWGPCHGKAGGAIKDDPALKKFAAIEAVRTHIQGQVTALTGLAQGLHEGIHRSLGGGH